MLLIVGCKSDPPVVNINTVAPPTNDVTFQNAFEIEEGSSLDLVLETGAAGASITTTMLPKNAKVQDGIFTFSPDYSQANLYSITFTITAGETVITKTIGVRVLNVIHIAAPALTVVPEGSPAPDLTFSSDDPPGTIVTLSADVSSIPGATFDPVAGKLTFAPGFKWLDSRPAALAILVSAEGQELDTGKQRTSTAKVLYQINEATSFKQELAPLFLLPPGATGTLNSSASPPPEAMGPDGHNCMFCHDGKPGAIAEMDFTTPDNIYNMLVNHDPEPDGINAATCGAFGTMYGLKRVTPGDPFKSLWFMKITGQGFDNMGNPVPICGVQMAENQPFNYWTVNDYDAWLSCPPGVTSCRTSLDCSDSDLDCKMNARMIRKARLWILAGAPNN
jgi:hypothetical protein